MVAKLQNEIKECKKPSFETNDGINKTELKEALIEEKMDTMRRDVSDIKLIYYACDESREECRKHRCLN